MFRMAVKFKGKVLMPMAAARVRQYVRDGKGKIMFDRKLKSYWLELLIEPSGTDTQDITLGIDPGSTFDGFSVVSENTHHVNVELIQRPKKGKNAITAFKARQAMARRVRRSRLRHRAIRFDSRTSSKLVPTIRANVEFRQWLITKLLSYYPITKVVIEDVKFNHYANRKGKSFSHVELGKTKLYDFIKGLGLNLELFEGFNTKKLRVNSFCRDTKSGDKGAKTFNAHCLDSFVLACNKSNMVDIDTGEILEEEPVISFDTSFVNNSVTFIEKVIKQRRLLIRVKRKINDAKRYFRYAKGGVKEYFTNISRKQNVCRVKPAGEHSNHINDWVYIDNGYAEKFKCFTSKYGGTAMVDRYGVRKTFFKDNEWLNRLVTFSEPAKGFMPFALLSLPALKDGVFRCTA